MRPLLVGEAPGASPSEPDEPLSGRIGERLAALCEMSLAEYLVTFERLNVLPERPPAIAGERRRGDPFTLRDAIPAARDRIIPIIGGRHVVLLGRAGYAVERALLELGAREARGLSWARFVWHHVRLPKGVASVTCCPHPSGRSRWWNVSEHQQEASTFWRSFAKMARVPSASP